MSHPINKDRCGFSDLATDEYFRPVYDFGNGEEPGELYQKGKGITAFRQTRTGGEGGYTFAPNKAVIRVIFEI